MSMTKTVTAKTLADNAPAIAEHVTAKAAAANKPADDKAGPLVAIPSPALACAILDGAVGADEWAAFRGQIAKLVDYATVDRAGMATLSGHLSALLAPVFMAASFDGEWYKRTAKAYGKKEADARQNKAAAKIKMAINGALQRKSPAVFSLTDWTTGNMAIFDATDCPATIPSDAKAAGFQPAAYKAAREAAIVRTNAQYDAEKRMAAEKEAAAFVASKADKLAASQATSLPAALPASKAGKDTGEAMAGIAAIMAALDDKTADHIDTCVLDSLAVKLAGYLAARHAADKAQAKARAKAETDKAAKATKAA